VPQYLSVAQERGPYQRKFPETWAKFLVFLMNNGPANKYTIMKSLGFRYSTAHHAVDRFEEWALLYPVKKGTARTGLNVKTYDLTVPGLAFSMLFWEDEVRWIECVKNHRDQLPLVFGKWEHFAAEGGEELAKRSLLGSLEVFFHDYEWDATYRDLGEMNAKTAEKISALFIMTPRGEFTQEELGQWYMILRKDPQLRSQAVRYLRGVVDDQLAELDDWAHLLILLGGSHPQGYTERLKHLIGLYKS
jgi:hypothetical protein